MMIYKPKCGVVTSDKVTLTNLIVKVYMTFQVIGNLTDLKTLRSEGS